MKQLPTPDAAETRLRALLDSASGAAAVAKPVENPPTAAASGQSRVPTLVDDVQGFLDKREKLERASYPTPTDGVPRC